MDATDDESEKGCGSEEKAEDEPELVDCRFCGRHFATDRVATHEAICQKQKKRRPFDIRQQRVRGTDAELFYKKTKVRSKTAKTSDSQQTPQKNWRKIHEEFISSLRAARLATAHLKKGGNVRDLPPPPPTDYSDYVQCPHCSRKFNSTAAERHIPKCYEMQLNKPKPSPGKTPAKNAPPKKPMTVRSRK